MFSSGNAADCWEFGCRVGKLPSCWCFSIPVAGELSMSCPRRLQRRLFCLSAVKLCADIEHKVMRGVAWRQQKKWKRPGKDRRTDGRRKGTTSRELRWICGSKSLNCNEHSRVDRKTCPTGSLRQHWIPKSQREKTTNKHHFVSTRPRQTWTMAAVSFLLGNWEQLAVQFGEICSQARRKLNEFMWMFRHDACHRQTLSGLVNSSRIKSRVVWRRWGGPWLIKHTSVKNW